MPVKVFFAGNPLAADDGIGPYLYRELQGNSTLKGAVLEEIGVIGFDMISYINQDDRIIIVDALRISPSEEPDGQDDANIGQVRILKEKELHPELSLVSQHDFGIEETARVIRMYYPNLPQIAIIGIAVRDTQPFSDRLSSVMKKKIGQVKKDVIDAIQRLSR